MSGGSISSSIALAFSAGAAVATGALYLLGSSSSSSSASPSSRKARETRDALVDDPRFNDKELLKQEFLNAFDGLAESFVAVVRDEFGLAGEPCERLRRMLHYTCLGGKYNRGIGVVETVRDICKERGLAFAPRVQSAMVLGWCTEILQAAFLVSDDVMDGSTTRRGQPCWYLQEDVKLDAINDALILETFLFQLIKAHFRESPNYVALLELFHRVSFQTEMGQMLDLRAQPQGRKGPEVLAGFNLDLYRNIVHYKTAFYTFYLPYASGMILCGLDSPEELRVAYDLSVELGEKFQIEDDYLDVYADPEVLGKVGTDIIDHKCSWLVVQVLERATPEQHAVLEANLGREDEASVQRVKDLYEEMNMREIYEQQEQDSYDRILAMIEDNKDVVPANVFLAMLNKIHKREK